MISLISGAASADDNSDTVPPIPIFDLVEFRYENSTPLVIDGSSSYDPNGNSGLTYVWSADFRGDIVTLGTVDNGSQALLPIFKAGSYKVRLTVFDESLNSASLEREIKIEDMSPTIDAVFGETSLFDESMIAEPESLGPWIIEAEATNEGDVDRIQCEWYFDSKIWLEGCKHSIQDWPLGSRESRQGILVVIDDDGSESTLKFTLVNDEDASTFPILFIPLLIVLILAFAITIRERRSRFKIPKWQHTYEETDHMLK